MAFSLQSFTASTMVLLHWAGIWHFRSGLCQLFSAWGVQAVPSKQCTICPMLQKNGSHIMWYNDRKKKKYIINFLLWCDLFSFFLFFFNFSMSFGLLGVPWYIHRSPEWEICRLQAALWWLFWSAWAFSRCQIMVHISSPWFSDMRSKSLLLIMWYLARNHGTLCMNMMYWIHKHRVLLY